MEVAQSLSTRVVAGIDIGGTKIAIGLVDDAGKVIVRAETPTHAAEGPAAASARIIEILRTITWRAGASIDGIGIGCTGPVDPITGELGDVCTLPGWQGWNPVQELVTALGVAVAMENDADAAALGEAQWGIGKGKSSLIGITVGTGIGAGIILNGVVFRGADGSHPELGHHIVEPLGPLCTCGALGCWESLASGPALEQWYAKHHPGELKTAREICDMARAGYPGAQGAVDRMARYLGLGLSNIVSMFVPEVIALSGGVMQSSDLFLDRILNVVPSNSRLVPAEKCEITVSSLGADAGLIGAAQVWRSRFGNHN